MIPRVFIVVPLLALLLATLAGCQPAIVSKLHGSWEAEGVEELAEQMTDGLPFQSEALGGLIDSAIQLAAEQVNAQMEVEFRADQILVTRTKLGSEWQVKTGTWRYVSSTDQQITIWCQLESDDPVEIKIDWIDDDTVKMVPPNIAVLKKSLTFHRVQQ